MGCFNGIVTKKTVMVNGLIRGFRMKRLALLAGLVLLTVPTLFGAGFGLYEGSARGNALGGLTGQADDASAIFFNPAGITQLEGRHIMLGATLIAPQAEVTTINSAYDGSSQTTSYKDNVFTPPQLYYTQQINQKTWFGAGLYTRFGLGSEFDNGSDWYGRYSNANTVIESVSISGHLAHKLNDMVSVSFGVVYNILIAELDQVIDTNRLLFNNFNDPTTSDLDVLQKLEGDSTGYGFNVAIHVKPDDRWSLGLMYNSEIEQEVEGTAKYEKPAGLPQTFFVDTNVTTDPIDLPFMLFLGASYEYSDKLTVGRSGGQTGWSSIKPLVFNYETPFVVIPGLGEQGLIDQASRELDWEDVWRFAVGFDHTISEKMHFMWGVTYDQSPIPDETISYLLPADDRTLINLGFTYDLGTWKFEGSYNYLSINDRDIEGRVEEGVYDGEVTGGLAHLLGFTLSRTF